MKKKIFVIFSFFLSFFAFAKDNFDTSTLDFIEKVYSRKIECSKDSFFENGFVKDRFGDFVTTWEDLNVRAVIKGGNLEKFSFESSDEQKILAGWKKALSYAQSKKCKTEEFQVLTASKIQTVTGVVFNNVALVNYYPYENKFTMSYSY